MPRSSCSCSCSAHSQCSSAASRGGRSRPYRSAGGGFGPRPLYPRRVTVVELGLYALLLAAAAIAGWRRPVVSPYLFVVVLVLHNAVMAALYSAGARGA